ncbi:MAG TPA: GntR family transcriptional regulator [Ramlibacter sp.]|uniref:GntR family transcriptional regulator n=1 Tax=Ramlibacter sp. TaxID=1917967 RepID=UPI002BCF2E08|nr:GntR family transcriptional regulator [Ramlibacter sp.]HVZ45725.1 GntR family transcriptional regulator [Ramlibacter sp.]
MKSKKLTVVRTPDKLGDMGLASPRSSLSSVDSAAQHIQQELRRAIVTLELPPGAHLSENEVALRFGVSRQPAREAMIALAKLGLVRVVPQRGTVVVKISARQVMQVRFTREAIETAIVRQACARFDPMFRASIDTILAAQRKAAKDGDFVTFQLHDERFHAALAAGADAELAWQAVIDIKAHMDRVCHLTLLDQKTVLGLIAQHETILAAIDAHDADAADRAMRRHLTEVLRSLPKVLVDRADLFE